MSQEHAGGQAALFPDLGSGPLGSERSRASCRGRMAADIRVTPCVFKHLPNY
jgi:hypothetical protein